MKFIPAKILIELPPCQNVLTARSNKHFVFPVIVRVEQAGT